VKILFNRTGEIGGEARYEFEDAKRPGFRIFFGCFGFENIVMPQAGVLPSTH